MLLFLPLPIKGKPTSEADTPDGGKAAYLKTGLPVMFIDTEEGVPVVERDSFLRASLYIVQNGDTLTPRRPLRIRGRGNSTWTFPKKPYKIRLDEAAPLLGMTRDKAFELLAGYCDKSLMRTAVGLRLAELAEANWTPECRYVELVLNGEYRGNYLLTESIKAKKGRIELGAAGYILELDFFADDKDFHFTTPTYGMTFSFKHPDDEDITAERTAAAEAYMNAFERIIDEPDSIRSHAYLPYIDLESFVKWYYQFNMLQLRECDRYYVNANGTANGRLAMGPMWDFDYSLGDYGDFRETHEQILYNEYYFSPICGDSLFMGAVAAFHLANGERIRAGVLAYFDELTEQLRASAAANYALWDNLPLRIGFGATPLGTWEAEVESARTFFEERYAFLDGVFRSYATGVNEVGTSATTRHSAIYDVSGRRLKTMKKGVNVVISNDYPMKGRAIKIILR